MPNKPIPRIPGRLLANPNMVGAESYWTPYNLSMTPQAIDVVAQQGQPFNEMVQRPQSYFTSMPTMPERDRLAEATAMWNRVIAPYVQQYPGEDFYPYTTLNTTQQMPQSRSSMDVSYVPQDELRGDLYPVRVPDELIYNKLMSLASAYDQASPNPNRFAPVKVKKPKTK